MLNIKRTSKLHDTAIWTFVKKSTPVIEQNAFTLNTWQEIIYQTDRILLTWINIKSTKWMMGLFFLWVTMWRYSFIIQSKLSLETTQGTKMGCSPDAGGWLMETHYSEKYTMRVWHGNNLLTAFFLAYFPMTK